jgi:hypothetical protein
MKSSAFVRPMDDDDLPDLYRHAFDQDSFWFRVAGGGLPWPNEFPIVLQDRLTMQYVIEVDGEFAGCAALFGHDKDAETMWLEVIPTVGHERSVVADSATALLVRAFRDWQVRKVFAAYHSCRPGPFDDLAVDWSEEGRLRDFHQHAGGFCDGVIAAIERDVASSLAEVR